MRRSPITCLCLAAACGGAGDVPPGTAGELPAEASSEPHLAPRPSPSPGAIAEVAVTEAGDAALTIDAIGALRLWPALDGSRQPVPVAANVPDLIALAPAGRELLAGVVDQAGAAQLIALGRDGAVHLRIQLPDDAPVEQVVALGDTMVFRRADQTIVRYDATGAVTATLAPLAGERVAALAVRHGTAVALIGDNPGAVVTMRSILVGLTLTWGSAQQLSQPVRAASVALAPSGRRLAAITSVPGSPSAVVMDLAPALHLVPGATRGVREETMVGFIDDSHLAITSDGVIGFDWWIEGAQVDPWNVVNPVPRQDLATGGVAASDRTIVTGFGPTLALTDPTSTRYLGWGQLALGSISASSTQLWMTSGQVLTRLDSDLAEVGSIDVAPLRDSVVHAIPVGARHLVVDRMIDHVHVVELIDLDHPVSHDDVLGTFTQVDHLELDDAGQTLAIANGGHDVPRWRLDLAHTRAVPLAPLHLTMPPVGLWLLDPERAGGTTAIVANEQGKHWLVSYEAPGMPWRQPIEDSPRAIDATGVAYEVLPTPAGHRVFARHGKRSTPLGETLEPSGVRPSHDASRVAVWTAERVELVDASGATRWKREITGIATVVFAPGDRRVVVQTAGGLIALDSATGESVATACGWGFGLHVHEPSVQIFGLPTVCEASGSP